MKYLVLIFGNTEQSWTGSDEDLAGLRALYVVKDELVASGELVSAEGLELPRDGKIVQVRGGAQVVTDGPFGEAKEQVAGYFLVDVASDERAQEIAGKVSAAVADRVELRGVLLSA